MIRLGRYRGKPLPEAVRAEIRRLLLAGVRWRDICEEVDVSQQMIAVVLRQAGGMPSRLWVVARVSCRWRSGRRSLAG